MADNIPIPVNAARRISDDYQQQIVVIVAWHQASNMINVVTYGEKPAHKPGAAMLGELLAKAAGAAAAKADIFEDYRTVKEAEWAAEKAGLLRRIDELGRDNKELARDNEKMRHAMAERDREDAEGPIL